MAISTIPHQHGHLARVVRTLAMVTICLAAVVQQGHGSTTTARACMFACGQDDGDPVLAQYQITDGSGNLVGDTPVQIEALPLNASSGNPSVVVGSGETDENGFVQAQLDDGLDGYASNAYYVTDDNYVNLEIYYQDADGVDWDDSGVSVQYYLGGDAGSYDPVVQQELLADDNGNPIANTTVEVDAVPVGSQSPGTDTGNQLVGGGTTDGDGHPCVTLSTVSSVLGNSTYDNEGRVKLALFTENSDGSLTFQATVSEYFSQDGVEDPILADTQITDPSSGAVMANTNLLVRVEPTDTSTYADNTAYPEAGTGATNAAGYADVVLNLNEL